MKNIYALIVISLLLVGCSNPFTPNKTTQNKVEMTTESVAEKPDTLIDEGKVCGGITDEPCTLPLFCVFDKNSATGSGTCQNLIIDKNLDCNDKLFKEEKPVQDPVCAIIGSQKYTLLNECEAVRRGASTLEKGFCKTDKSAKNNCEATAFGIGTCFSTTEAWEFDGKQCNKRFITGCDHEVPFDTKAQCEQKCN